MPPPVGLGRMLRIYFLQQWFDLLDPAVEEPLDDSASMRQFICWRSIGWASQSSLRSMRI